MKKYLKYTVFCFLLIFTGNPAPESVQQIEYSGLHKKPDSPLKIKFQELNAVSKNEVFTVKVDVETFLNNNSVDFELVLPENIELVSGEKKWAGSLPKGGKKQFTFSLRCRDDGEFYIKGAGKMHMKKSGALASNGTLKIVCGNYLSKKAAPVIVTNPDGSKLQVSKGKFLK